MTGPSVRGARGAAAVAMLPVLAAGVGAVGVGALVGTGGKVAVLALALVVLAVVATATVTAPRVVYGITAFTLGAAPYTVLPGLGLPTVLLLAVLCWVALLTHPIHGRRSTALEAFVAVLVVTSTAAMLMTADDFTHIVEFVKWVVATSVVFLLLRLDRATLRAFGVTYAWGTAVGAAFALAMFFFDKAGTSLNYLGILGYGPTGTIGTHLRFYVVDNSRVVRLTGTFVDPNAAGIFLLIGLALAIALLRGWSRTVVTVLVGGALIVTLSRSAIFSVIVALVLYLLFQRMDLGRRMAIALGAVVTGLAAMSVPAISARVLGSFGTQDKGAQDRADALTNFVQSMQGRWWFGHGWGAREFIDEQVGYNTNYVANTPLLTAYRGGVVVGLAMVGVLIAAALLAYRRARRDPWESGVIGAFFVGFSLVGLQLDFPVVTNPPLTMAFSVFIALVAANPVTDAPPDEPPDDQSPPAQRASAATSTARSAAARA